MRVHYITLHVVERARTQSQRYDTFTRLAALSSSRPHINSSVRIPVERHKQPGGGK